MPREQEQEFIRLATRPLAERAKEQAAAADELAARLAHADPADKAAALPDAVRRLEAKAPPPPWRLPLAAGTLLLLLLAALAILIPRHWREARILHEIHEQGRSHLLGEWVLRSASSGKPFPPHLHGLEIRQEEQMHRAEAFWKDHPESPAAYSLYIRTYLEPDGSPGLPQDYRETWQRLDSGNALWLLMGAERNALRALSGRGSRTVADEARFQQVLGALRAAAQFERASSTSTELGAIHRPYFRFDAGLAGVHQRRLVLSGGWSDMPFLNGTLVAVEIQAGRLEAAGDEEGMRALVRDLRHVLKLVTDSGRSADLTFNRASITARNMALRCGSMGLKEEEAWLERVRDAFPAYFTARRSAPGPDPRLADSLARQWAGYHLPNLTDEELEPGRLAEYAVADRFTALAGLLAAMLGLGLYGLEMLRRGAGPRGLARGIAPLFRGGDWLWLFGGGLLLPLLWWCGIVWVSPLGCRDIALSYYEFNHVPLMQPWLSQGLGGVVLILVAMVQIARWRWGKRGDFLCLRPERMWIGWAMLALAALFIPLQGIVRYLPARGNEFLLYGSAAGGIPLLWLCWQAGTVCFHPREGSLAGMLLPRTLVPALAAMALLMAAAMPLLRTREIALVEASEILAMDPQDTMLMVMDRKVLMQAQEFFSEAIR